MAMTHVSIHAALHGAIAAIDDDLGSGNTYLEVRSAAGIALRAGAVGLDAGSER